MRLLTQCYNVLLASGACLFWVMLCIIPGDKMIRALPRLLRGALRASLPSSSCRPVEQPVTAVHDRYAELAIGLRLRAHYDPRHRHAQGRHIAIRGRGKPDGDQQLRALLDTA